VTFSVKAAAIPKPSYQWSRNGAGIPGATGATLKLDNIRANNAGSYTVTVINASGRTTSNPATLTVR